MSDGKSAALSYPLLSFDYDKEPYEKTLSLNPHPSFMEYVTPDTEDYTHDEFGYYSEDEQRALAHAAGILRKLENTSKTGIRRDIFTKSLKADLKNYCICVRNGIGSKETLCELMEAVLFYEMPDTVCDEVMECNKRNHEESMPESAVFDFEQLYIKQADRLLFLENDIERALKFYRLAALNWDVDETCSSKHSAIKCEKDKPNLKKAGYYTIDFSAQYELYASIARGERYQNLHVPLFAERYNHILDSKGLLEEDARLLELLADFTETAQSFLNGQPERKLRQKRLAVLMYLALLQKYLPFELAKLMDDPNRRRFKKLSLEKGRLLRTYPCSLIAIHSYFASIGPEFPYDCFLILAKTFYLSCLLLEELDAEKNMKTENNDQYIAYYTSADVFSYMLPEKCTGEKKDRLGKLTVMHLSYMNDPNEGQTLRKAIYGSQLSSGRKSRKKLNVPYVFVKCFSPRIDYLPMWEMYGDHACGCCLVIDWLESKKGERGTEPVLYNVCYLHKAEERYFVSPEDNERLSSKQCETINAQLQQLRELTGHLPENDEKIKEGYISIVRSSLDEILGKILYLFKDSSYSYEQEMRVIYQTKNNILHTEGESPWLFVQTPFPLRLKEVILGPKFSNVSTRIPYLQEQIEKMCDMTGTRKPEITLSEIDYR